MSLLLTIIGLACWVVLFLIIDVLLEELTPIPERHRFSLAFSTPPMLFFAAVYLPDYFEHGIFYGEWSNTAKVVLTLYGAELLFMLAEYIEHLVKEHLVKEPDPE